MGLKAQHTGKIFTFLAGLIILAHTIAPHHHHFDFNDSSVQELTCHNTSQDESPEEQDFHCYAFNVMVSEKTSNSSGNNSLLDFFNNYVLKLNLKIEIPFFTTITATFLDYQAVFLHQYFISARSLRAPPAFS